MTKGFIKVTEQPSNYRHLEKMSIKELLKNMNKEDQTVPYAVAQALPQIEALVKVIVQKLKAGGRLFYIGAGTSGRLGILDASECPPTFGVAQDLIVGIIAGGADAITQAVEKAEDNVLQGWEDLCFYEISSQDIVLGLSTSGTTPYVLAALKKCQEMNIITGCIICNKNTPIYAHANFPVEVVVGPEFLTASTRLKAGTAQKLILNMISTATMVQLGRVMDNQMINMQLTNEKLIDRGSRILMEKLNIHDYEVAHELLLKHGSVAEAIQKYTDL